MWKLTIVCLPLTKIASNESIYCYKGNINYICIPLQQCLYLLMTTKKANT